MPERKQEAVALIEKNCTKYGLANVKVICGEAPGALTGLPVPTHAFIGWKQWQFKGDINGFNTGKTAYACGSDGNYVRDGWGCFFYINEFPVEQEEIIQMSVSRAKKAGRYHLMQAENPVFILSFYFAGGTES